MFNYHSMYYLGSKEHDNMIQTIGHSLYGEEESDFHPSYKNVMRL